MIYTLAIVVGICATLQSTLNRQIGASWGLVSTLVLTCTSMLVACVLLYALVRVYPAAFPDFFRDSQPWTNFKLWYLIPGVIGLVIIVGYPFTISKIGATSVFILAIVGQIITSILWDYYIEKIPINFYRVAAAVMCITGAYLSTKSS